jgi:hypothetical protein
MAKRQASYWTYQAGDIPTYAEAVAIGAVAAGSSEAEWERLSPGYRREIVRSATRAALRRALMYTENIAMEG